MTPPDTTVKEEDEELAALGGKTRLVSRRSPSTPNSPQDSLHLHHTPSPHNSPVQYTVEHVSPVHDRVNGTYGMNGMAPWQGYQQQPVEESYPGYFSSTSGSVPGHYTQYGQVPSPHMVIASGSQYSPYEQMSPVAGYLPTHSPVDTQVLPDPQASWQNLYAQYQPGMSG